MRPSRTALTLLGVVLTASWAARAQEAVSFNAPIRVEYLDGGVRWESPDGGVCLTPDAFKKVDDRLTLDERWLNDKTSTSTGFFWGGVLVGGIVTSILAGLVAYAVIKH